MLLMTSSRTSLIMAEKNGLFIAIFSHFTSIILPCGSKNFKFNNGCGLLSSLLLFYRPVLLQGVIQGVTSGVITSESKKVSLHHFLASMAIYVTIQTEIISYLV